MSALRTGLVTAFGLGLLRPAPGTWGSTPPVVIAFAISLASGHQWTIDVVMIALAVAFSIICIVLGDFCEKRFGRKDPGEVVADEVAGQSLALLFLPWRAGPIDETWKWNAAIALIGFAMFRLFDIWKPPPARSLQRFRSGWGILVDDLIAGAYALIATQLIVRFALPLLFNT